MWCLQSQPRPAEPSAIALLQKALALKLTLFGAIKRENEKALALLTADKQPASWMAGLSIISSIWLELNAPLVKHDDASTTARFLIIYKLYKIWLQPVGSE